MHFLFFVILGADALGFLRANENLDCAVESNFDCKDDSDCKSETRAGGTCVDTVTLTGITAHVGPVDILNPKTCECSISLCGPKCQDKADTSSYACQNKNCGGEVCQGDTANVVVNGKSSCSCKNFQRWGWNCEHENKELCKYVDRGK